ncbi:MAG: type II secretion system protein GspM [Panacagrimonas sp.]
MNKSLDSARQHLTQARERFLALQMRERVMVVLGSSVVLITLLYLLIWEPLVKAHSERAQALQTSRALAVRLEGAAQQVQTLRSRNPAATQGRSMSLMSAVDQASKQGSLGKGPSRIQPEGDREVRVWFEDVSFDAMVRWLADLQSRYGVSVQTLDVEPQAAPGRVNVRLSLVRAP